MEPFASWYYIVTFLGPLVAFFVGVVISDWMKLYAALERKHIYLMSLPVGLVTVGILVSGASVVVNNTTMYGYTESFPAYITFFGTIMFYGTLVPEMFEVFRKKIRPPQENSTSPVMSD